MGKIRISSSALVKPASTAGFDVLKYSGDSLGTKENIVYRALKAKTTGEKWFIEFYYRIPEKVRQHYGKQRWKRFKLYKDINIMRTPEYTVWLLGVVRRGLEDGWSPFEGDLEVVNGLVTEEKHWTVQQAALFFLQKWENRGLTPESLAKYNRSVKRFTRWLEKKGLQHADVNKINSQHLEVFLEEHKQSEQWANSTYNGERGFLSTMFNFLERKKIIKNKPEAGDKLKSTSKKHRYFDDRTYERLKKVLHDKDPYLYFACQCVYYLCIRSEKELQHLKVGNISIESKQVLLTVGKTGQRFIPLVDEMIKVFQERRIMDYNPEYYVFSVPHKNKFVPDGKPGPEPFRTGFFSKRFSKIRKEAGLSSDHTIMGFRHTRAIHLKSDGVKDHIIQALMGHTDFITTSKYLRDLGLNVDTETLNEKTRKI